MSAVTSKSSIPTRTHAHRWSLTFFGVIRGEWIKFWSLRSSWVVVPLAYIFSIIPALFLTFGTPIWDNENVSTITISILHSSFSLSQYLIIAYSVVIVTSEWTTGSIYGTVSAVPQRSPIFFAKLLVSIFITILVASLGMLTIMGVLTTRAGSINEIWANGNIWLTAGLVLLGIVFYGVLATCTAFLLRNTAVSLVIVYIFTTIVETSLFFLAIRFDWMAKIVIVLPSSLVRAIMGFAATESTPSIDDLIDKSSVTFTPEWGLAAMLIWVLTIGGLAWFMLKRRDI